MHSALLETLPRLVYGYSTRVDGNMLVQTRPDLLRDERVAFFRAHDLEIERTAGCGLVHGTHIQEVPVVEKRPLFFSETDGLMTLDPSRILTVTGADCFPIFVVDARTHCLGLCHAGWRGTKERIVPRLLTRMRERYHSRTEDLLVLIGPGIRACHFETKMDVWSLFPEAIRHKHEGRTSLDLPALLRTQIEDAAPHVQIEDTKICTSCNPDLFSFRRDKPASLQAHMAYLGWRF